MLRDDAIRQGLLKPTKEDIERMNLKIEEEPKKRGPKPKDKDE